MAHPAADVLVIGGGLAGLVTTLECLRAGRSVTLLDRDTPERLGGLARWAFGGMCLVDTPLQRRKRIPDSPELALRDWVRFGELAPDDLWPLRWAEHYVERSTPDVYEYLQALGVGFMPAVNWVERGLQGQGNSVPRYHVVWGTSLHLTQAVIAAVQRVAQQHPGRLALLHRQRVTDLIVHDGRVRGAVAVHEETGAQQSFEAGQVVVATGGLNGSLEQVRRHWPADKSQPAQMLNGAHPYADGVVHAAVQAYGGRIHHAGDMWNYAAGVPHPQPHFQGHGLSLIPCKSALWLDHAGRRLGPQPLVTGFDTHDLCQQVAQAPRGYTWHLLNWRIAAKELAISGAEHNPHIRDRRWLPFLKELLLGNHRLVRQMLQESPHFVAADSIVGLAQHMNALAGNRDIDPATLQATVDNYDRQFSQGVALTNDDQVRRIMHARQWGPDRLRTCAPAPLSLKGSGPYIAIQVRLITRKSLGGLQTDLRSRVLNDQGQALPGLYAVGEAAGFGGGGASGKRSLEGAFLPGCILTAQAAARDIA
ncbi:FAD-dependent oxidoreductase [Curvibacter sp. CHRR-16]|uniref:FAD-dependent oxidoreductase n=1 Tax=Curvibacter sp. CHRR-16 TaxID=2835872 RepID=UPI001BDB3A88|nr:FAD-dependent oxidoreductase [Curvibacter sp. CHRR-16]MBT0570171.1 FAD-dependent oxidoreductase [Curvibacter sp. CHRR-16]